MAGRLAGKVALLTAAARGIGRATAEAFAAEGAEVIATDVEPDAHVVRLDAADGDAVAAFVAGLGRVDVLYNGVGWTHHGDALHTSPGDWRRSFALNVDSMYHMLRAVLPGMIARGGGSIINIGSVQSSLAATPERFAYGATKGAVIGLTKSVARDYAAQGIRCNVICPAAVETPGMLRRVADHADPAAELRARALLHPVGRVGRAEEVAAVAVLLASDEARFMTGSVVVVDGGYTL